MSRPASILALIAVGCGRATPPPNNPAGSPVEEPPVALNAEPAVQYPPDLYDQRIEGDVILRLFADSTGRLAPESTKVAESSGYTALDSAAVRGAVRFRYAPARRHGLPIATAFLQTIEFRHPGAGSAPPAPASAAPGPSTSSAPVSHPTPPDSGRAVPSTARVSRDSARVRRDSGGAPAGSTTRPDSASQRPDTTARRDTSGTTY